MDAGSAATHGPTLGHQLIGVVALLGAGVLAVPLFRRLGLGSVLGYLAAGVLVGPFGLGIYQHPQTILHVAELGVVLFLFIIGLEMQPSRLWSMRKDIFGLGLTQVAVCGALLTVLGMIGWQLKLAPAFVIGMGFVLSSTAIVMQLLEERGEVDVPKGRKIVAILLLEDLAIVPLLAIVAALAPASAASHGGPSRGMTLLIALGAVVGLVAVSRWLLNPLFRWLANAHAREVMTAAALLVVLGAAVAMDAAGLSMAMGAFAAGVMLSESSFRHQLEADIEPFRGLLLGLFFIGVGMTLDLGLVQRNPQLLITGTLAYMAVKAFGVYAVGRLAGGGHRDAIERAALMAQGGEFAFVLYAAAAQAGLIDARLNAALTAAIILSMALTPLLLMAVRRLLPEPTGHVNLDGVDAPHDLDAPVLVIGFGRFGQIVSQALLMRGVRISVIDTDTEMIRAAARFGSRVWYGDGTRLDVLHASGVEHARAVLICIDDKAAATRIAELLHESYPQVPVLARAFDRQHAFDLIRHGVAFQMRETFESALALGRRTLETLGATPDETAALIEHLRMLDAERFEAELLNGFDAERTRAYITKAGGWAQTPLIRPAQQGEAANPEAAEALRQAGPDAGARPA